MLKAVHPFKKAIVAFVLILLIGSLSYNFLRTEEGYIEEENEEEEYLRALEGFDVWTDMRAYPFKQIPNGRFSKAFEQFKKDRVAERKMLSSNASIAQRPEAVQSVLWTPLAPKNFAGRILCLAFHPTNQNIMWAGSASGGLWKTTNGGTGGAGGINWVNVPTGFNTLGVSAIAIQQSDPNIMYVGTGEVYNVPGDYNGRNVRTYRGTYGIGILKSIDGGVNWTKTLDFSMSDLKGVADILIHPTNPSIVFAATSEGVYRTTNAGGSWTLIHNIALAQDICFKPGNPDVLYIGSGNFASTGHGIYKTTNANAATPTFTKLAGGLPPTFSGIVRLHISAANTSKVFASVGKAPGTSDANGLHVSNDEGATWAKVNTATDYINNQGWYAHDVVVDPSNANNVYVAEMDIWSSTNGGATITQRTFWNQWDFNNTTVGATAEGTANTYVHADIHHLYISPFSNTTIFAVCDGGVFKSTNSSTSYIGLNGGLQTAQIYADMAQSTVTPNFMICGLQDNATFIYNGNPGSARKIGGDGFSAIITPGNDANCLGTLYYNTIYRSTNGGSTFGSAAVLNNSSNGENAAFSAPLAMAPSNTNIVYSATHRLKKSTNNGQTWANIGGILVSAANPIMKLAVAPTDPNIVIAATAPGGANRSKLFKSTNGGTSFTEITGTVLPDRYYSDIKFDPSNNNRFVVTLAGYNTSHVYLTTDGGTTFVNIGQGLPDVPHHAVVFDPANGQTIIVGNDLGVYYAQGVTNGSTAPTWNSYNEGFIDATLVVDLAVTSTNILRVGTHGKGLWERAMPALTLPLNLISFKAECNSNNRTLSWTTTNETEMSHFEVEVSENSRDYKKIGTVNAKNASNNKYSFIDNNATSSKLYYRLKMVNVNGSFTYSDVASTNCFEQAKFTIYPNPTKGQFNLVIPSLAFSGNMNVSIVNQKAQKVYNKVYTVYPGVNTFNIDISNLPSGIYTVVAEQNGTRTVQQVIKK